MVEQLTCNQQVVGSIPIASSILFMEGFPSGQREQTVNLPSQTSMVRIHPHPPKPAGMAELADAHGSGPCEGDFMQVQVLFPAPRRGKVRFAPFFLFKKNLRPLPCPSFSAKSRARFGCALVNAGPAPPLCCQLFAVSVCCVLRIDRL